MSVNPESVLEYSRGIEAAGQALRASIEAERKAQAESTERFETWQREVRESMDRTFEILAGVKPGVRS